MPEQVADGLSADLALQLDEAWEKREPILPLTEQGGLETVEQAYAVQSEWTKLRLRQGDRIVGRKIGLTSLAMQEQMGVDEPDYGTLWASRYFPSQNDAVEMPGNVFLQPRVEGEIAFLIDKPLTGPSTTADDVLEATEAVAVAIEVVDSRIKDWRITLMDTVADNASFGGFTRGLWSKALLGTDLQKIEMSIYKNEELIVEGTGADVLQHPARAVAWLANKLSSFGVSLQPGDVVLSGSLGRAVPAESGDSFLLTSSANLSLSVAFT